MSVFISIFSAQFSHDCFIYVYILYILHSAEPAAVCVCSISQVSCCISTSCCRFQRQKQCCRQTAAAAAGDTQRPDPLLELTRSEVFAPQLGGKEGCWTQEQTSSATYQHHLRSEPHTSAREDIRYSDGHTTRQGRGLFEQPSLS